MVFGLIVAVLGLTLLALPTLFVSWVRLYRSGSVLSINAPVKSTPSPERTRAFGRAVGLVLVLGGIVLAVIS
jgi:hypothetical protein